MVAKISWVKRILQTESNILLKHLYENVFKQFGGNILLECNFREADIIKHSIKNIFLEIYYWHGQNLPTKQLYQIITMRLFGAIPTFALAETRFSTKNGFS